MPNHKAAWKAALHELGPKAVAAHVAEEHWPCGLVVRLEDAIEMLARERAEKGDHVQPAASQEEPMTAEHEKATDEQMAVVRDASGAEWRRDLGGDWHVHWQDADGVWTGKQAEGAESDLCDALAASQDALAAVRGAVEAELPEVQQFDELVREYANRRGASVHAMSLAEANRLLNEADAMRHQLLHLYETAALQAARWRAWKTEGAEAEIDALASPCADDSECYPDAYSVRLKARTLPDALRIIGARVLVLPYDADALIREQQGEGK